MRLPTVLACAALTLGCVLGASGAHAEDRPLTCSTGTLFAGDPAFDGAPNDRAQSGAPLKGGIPFHFQNLAFVGDTLYTRDAGELWAVDMKAANPVVRRVAGKNPKGSNYAFTAGSCADARFGWIKGVAGLPDGSLLVVDGLANAVLEVKDPRGAGCTVEYYAGTRTAKPEFNPSSPPNAGDADGPGAKAKFSNPGPIVTDEAGNAYVYDSDARKIKKIANDAAHTVSTLGGKKIEAPYTIRSMTRIGGKLYGVGDDSSTTTVVEVDTKTGETRKVIEGKGAAFPPAPSYRGATIHGITTDGNGLVLSGMGFVWYLTTAGKLTHVAGEGTSPLDFPQGKYDAKAPQPAMKLQLPGARTSTSPNMEVGSFESIAFYKGAIYSRHTKGPGYFVERIACP